MQDETENYRRAHQAQINYEASVRSREADARAELEARYGQVWSVTQIRDDFEVLAFAAPFMIVRRKSDGKKGSLEFQHSPRFYWGWQEDQ